jgi:hypothetical protein
MQWCNMSMIHKGYMLCAVSSCKMHRPFSFVKPAVTDINYLDKLQLWLIPQLHEVTKDFIVQEDKALPHFHIYICAHLSANPPCLWIGHVADNDSHLHPWLPWSSNLTHCNFFL